MKNITRTEPKETGTRSLDFEKFYQEISRAWEEKAKDLQARRWKALNQTMKKEHFTFH